MIIILRRAVNATLLFCVPVAQLVDHTTFNRKVLGSNPNPHIMYQSFYCNNSSYRLLSNFVI